MNLKRFSIMISSAAAVMIVIFASFLITITTRMRTSALEINSAIHSIRASEELQIQLLNFNRETFLYGLTRQDNHLSNRDHARSAITLWLAEAKKYLGGQEEVELYSATASAFESYLSFIDRISTSQSPLEAYNLANPILEIAFAKANDLTNLNLQQAEALQKKLADYDNLANWLGGMLALFIFLIFPVSWAMVENWIYGPLKNLHRGITSFGKNERTKVEERGLLELRETAQAFNEVSFRLEEQKKFQLRFLAGVAHDLRNPLGAIQMSSDLLLKGEAIGEESFPIIEIISRQTKQLDRLVGDLLDATRIESGEFELKRENVNIVSLVKDSVELHRSVSSIHKIEFLSETADVTSHCDPVRIGQVISNLLSNAIKYSPNGGRIDVSVEALGEKVFIRVRDEGIGISEEDQKYIFEPFRRTQLTKASIPGVGLGLSVAKRIVKAHKGEIEVRSRPQEGTNITVWLPAGSE